MDGPKSLLQLCVRKLAQNLIKYGPKKVRFASLSGLPWRALEALLEILVARNGLNDNVLPHALTPQTKMLGLEGSCQLRRCVLNTIGRSCPNLRVLDFRGCHQVDNRIVRDVLQCCERLVCLRLDGCNRISDSAFAPALWRPPLAGLLGLRELSVNKCCQITAEGLMGYVLKGAPYLRNLGLAFCRLMITDDVMSELLFSFGLEVLDVSFCAQITDGPFQARPNSLLRELRLAHTQVSDVAIENLAQRAPLLELFDASWMMKFTDVAVLALTAKCPQLRTLCVCNTQITDKSFTAIVQCRHLERLDASWCIRATPEALNILACGHNDERPPIREFILDHLGALNLSEDQLGPLPPPASPGLWDMPIGRGDLSKTASPLIMHWLPTSALPLPCPPLLEPLSLPGPALSLPPSEMFDNCSAAIVGPTNCDVVEVEELSTQKIGPTRQLQTFSPLRNLAVAFAPSLEKLLLDGVRDAVDQAALEALATKCPSLQQLALTIPVGLDNEATLETHLRSIGSLCTELTTLRLDACSRTSHKAVVAALALPSFAKLNSLTLWCSTKAGGLVDAELDMILSGRTDLNVLHLMNCEGLSDGLFPRWCNRGERHDEALVVEQLDQVLLSSQIFGHGEPGPASSSGRPGPSREAAVSRSRRHLPRCPAATALRSVTSLSLGGALALSDNSCYALAELLHDAQTVEVRGSPLLTEESLRAFRKTCRFLRLASIVTRDRTLTWVAATSAVKKHHHRYKKTCTSGSSGTESN